MKNAKELLDIAVENRAKALTGGAKLNDEFSCLPKANTLNLMKMLWDLQDNLPEGPQEKFEDLVKKGTP